MLAGFLYASPVVKTKRLQTSQVQYSSEDDWHCVTCGRVCQVLWETRSQPAGVEELASEWRSAGSSRSQYTAAGYVVVGNSLAPSHLRLLVTLSSTQPVLPPCAGTYTPTSVATLADLAIVPPGIIVDWFWWNFRGSYYWAKLEMVKFWATTSLESCPQK